MPNHKITSATASSEQSAGIIKPDYSPWRCNGELCVTSIRLLQLLTTKISFRTGGMIAAVGSCRGDRPGYQFYP